MNSAELDLPEGMTLRVVTDASVSTQARIATVAGNAYTGLLLVLFILALFLRFKIAMWVAAGIPNCACQIALPSKLGPSQCVTYGSVVLTRFVWKVALRLREMGPLKEQA